MSEQKQENEVFSNPKLEKMNTLPWHQQPSMVSCNNAVGGLSHALQEHLSQEGRLHAETLLSAIGCIAGYATKIATLNQMQQEGIALEPPEIQIATLKNGKNYLYSERVNQALLNGEKGEKNTLSFWALAAGPAFQSGGGSEAIPKLDDMFTLSLIHI